MRCEETSNNWLNQKRKLISVLALLVLNLSVCRAQTLHIIYEGVSPDSLYAGHFLNFVNDTSVELRSYPHHMSRQLQMTLKYLKKGDLLEIRKPRITTIDSTALINFKFRQFTSKLSMSIGEKVLIDDVNNVIYVRAEDFKHKYYFSFFVEGKLYKQRMQHLNTYGLIEKTYRKNRALKRKLASMHEVLENYNAKIIRGLDAYRKFGYENVFGVIELTRKE